MRGRGCREVSKRWGSTPKRSPAIRLLDFGRADIRARLGRVPEAKAAFEEEIANFPRDRDAYASLAVLQWLEGDRAASERTMQRLVRAMPDKQTYLFVSQSYQQIGDRVASDR